MHIKNTFETTGSELKGGFKSVAKYNFLWIETNML
jgi:hypothetical protein